MEKRVLKLVISLGVAAIVCGCNSEIDLVKNGTLQGYEQTTIGKAVGSVFGEVEWNYFETEKGVRIVEAKGWPGKSFVTLEDRKQQCENPQKVVIQFMLHTNSESFEIGYCGFGKKALRCNYLLNYIYDNNSSYDPNFCPVFKKMIDPRDQKEYRTVVIESQEWMAQNLNYEMDGSYCCDDELEKCNKFGRMYKWDAARNACPEGWNLPTKKDFYMLFDAVGGWLFAGKMLKSNAVDAFGFTALFAGFRGEYTHSCVDAGKSAYFWGLTDDGNAPFGIWMDDRDAAFEAGGAKSYNGFSVRCVKQAFDEDYD
jgi:uncharacterized protein (TIGR02145 family)